MLYISKVMRKCDLKLSDIPIEYKKVGELKMQINKEKYLIEILEHERYLQKFYVYYKKAGKVLVFDHIEYMNRV